MGIPPMVHVVNFDHDANQISEKPVIQMEAAKGRITRVYWTDMNRSLVTSHDGGFIRKWDTEVCASQGFCMACLVCCVYWHSFHNAALHVSRTALSWGELLCAMCFRACIGEPALDHKSSMPLACVQTGKMTQERQIHDDAIQDMQLSPDGAYVVTASLDKTAKIIVGGPMLAHAYLSAFYCMSTAFRSLGLSPPLLILATEISE